MTQFLPSESSDAIQVRPGHAAVFEFPSLQSEPAPAVSWQAEDDSLLYGPRYATTFDNKLIILSVDQTDEKRYR